MQQLETPWAMQWEQQWVLQLEQLWVQQWDRLKEMHSGLDWDPQMD